MPERPCRTTLAAAVAAGVLCVVLAYSGFDYRQREQVLKARVQELEAEIDRSAEACEIRVAQIKAEQGATGGSDEVTDRMSLAELIAALPPDFLQRLSESILTRLPDRALCGAAPPASVIRGRRPEERARSAEGNARDTQSPEE